MPHTLYETFRLDRLNRLGLLDSPPEDRFDRITRLAREIFEVDVSLVTFLDAHRQWSKSSQGLEMSETPREVAFCDYAIAHGRELVVTDALQDERFCNNPLVTGAPGIRFYAGIPIREPTGFKLGTLCVIGSEPQEPKTSQMRALKKLAKRVEYEIAVGFYRDIGIVQEIDSRELLRTFGVVRNAIMASGDDRSTVEDMLEDLQVVTRSPVAAIIDLGDDDTQPMGHDDLWSIMDGCADLWVAGTSHHELMSWLRGGREPIQNRLAHPGVSTVPEETGPDRPVALQCRQVLPALAGDRLVGLVLLANREGGYPPGFVESLAPLSLAVGALIDRYRIEKRKNAQAILLDRAAHYDPLTDLPNRTLMNSLMKERLHDAQLSQEKLDVYYINIDDLNRINTRYGRAAGNEVLRVVADRLKGTVNGRGVAARIGGDEFVLGLPQSGQSPAAEDILRILNEPHGIRSDRIRVGASVGLATFPDDGADVDPLLRYAAQAMLEIKQAGKNQYQRFDRRRHRGKLEQARICREVEEGLAKGHFELFLQPKIHLASQKVTGFEALIRWNHPVDGLRTPGQFLPHIVSSETDNVLGKWVLRRAVNILRRFAQAGLDYDVSINLSPHHFLDPGFIDDLKVTLAGVPDSVVAKLILEIVETTALDDTRVAIESIHLCRELGCRVSLDDFGTGYSSLSHFRKLPLDEIKIDRSFVMELLDNEDDAKIVRSIVNLSRQFGRTTVAEGVESLEVAQYLSTLGCDVGQGFFFSQPQPLDSALRWAEAFEARAQATRPLALTVPGEARAIGN